MLRHFLKKIYKYEYWPFWIFYMPFIPLYLWFSLRNASLLYFCRINPSMRYGGLFGYSKSKITQSLPSQYLPKEQIVKNKQKLIIHLSYPLIAKPDIGERGKGVVLINNLKSLKNYLSGTSARRIILQEFMQEPMEFGLFYYREPKNSEGKILSITGKKFLTFKGDGKQTLKEFICKNERAYFQKKELLRTFKNQLNNVLPPGKELLLEPIGNHCRGTYFYDASHLISNELTRTLNQILKPIDGFYYGRLDVKASSENSLSKGIFRVIEINGANSEPTHIYDHRYSLVKAYKEVYKMLCIQSKIALQQKKNNISSPSLLTFLNHLYHHLK